MPRRTWPLRRRRERKAQRARANRQLFGAAREARYLKALARAGKVADEALAGCTNTDPCRRQGPLRGVPPERVSVGGWLELRYTTGSD